MSLERAAPQPGRPAFFSQPVPTVDLAEPGIDKAYGTGTLPDILVIAIGDIILIRDAVCPGGGDDYAGTEAGEERRWPDFR